MSVFVLNKHGEALIPCKARILLDEKKAKIVKHHRLTIQLEHGSMGYIAKGTQNKGVYVAFMDGSKKIVKNIKRLTLVYQNKGIIYA